VEKTAKSQERGKEVKKRRVSPLMGDDANYAGGLGGHQ